jgi:glycosyltransferase involved in cell wall biosynthesis
MTRVLRIAMLGTRGMPTTYGGVERAVEELSVRLAARGHEVTAYCRSQYCGSRASEYRGVRLRYFPTLNTKHLETISHTALATIDAMCHDFDVVHYHATGSALLSPIPRLLRRPAVVTVQGLDYQRAKWGRAATLVLRAGAWTAARAPRRTIVVSRTLENHFRTKYGVEARYIPNGVPVASGAAAVPPLGLTSRRYFLFVGRFVPEKAVHVLIRAYRELDSPLPLIIAGSGSHSDGYVRRLRRDAARDERVRLVGPVYGAEKDALLAHALAFCQPSELEGLPIALLEAMSHKCPPIVSDLPEHLEVVRRGSADAAWVFRRGDAGSLRAALALALSAPEVAARMGEAARDIVRRHYGWDAITEEVESLYLEILDRDDRTARLGPGLVSRTDSAVSVKAHVVPGG